MTQLQKYKDTYELVKRHILTSDKPNIDEANYVLFEASIDERDMSDSELVYNTQPPICTLLNPMVTQSQLQFKVVNLYSLPYLTDRVELFEYIDVNILDKFCIWPSVKKISVKQMKMDEDDPKRFDDYIQNCLFFDCFPYLKNIFQYILPQLERLVHKKNTRYREYNKFMETLSNNASINPIDFFLLHYMVWMVLRGRTNIFDSIVYDIDSNSITDQEYKTEQRRLLKVDMLAYLKDEMLKIPDMTSVFINGPWHIKSITDRLNESEQYINMQYDNIDYAEDFLNSDVEICISQQKRLIHQMTLNTEFDFPLFLEYIFLRDYAPQQVSDTIGSMRGLYQLTAGTLTYFDISDIYNPLVSLRFYEMILTNVIPNLRRLGLDNVLSDEKYNVYTWMMNIVLLYDIMGLPFWEANDYQSIMDYKKSQLYTHGQWHYGEDIYTLKRLSKKYQRRLSSSLSNIKESLVYSFYTNKVMVHDVDAQYPNIDKIKLHKKRFKYYKLNEKEINILTYILGRLYSEIQVPSQLSGVKPPPFIARSSAGKQVLEANLNNIIQRIVLKNPKVIEFLETYKDSNPAKYRRRLEFFENLFTYL